MSIGRSGFVAAAMLMALALPAAGQQAAAAQDSIEAQLRPVLRAFYFNLAHHDWEAIAADVLSAKVLASRPVPEGMLGSTDKPVTCSPTIAAAVDEAVIQRDGEWAAVSIPRCDGASAGTDEFRLIHFEKRWRLVYLDLFEGADIASADR
jgi:hypothetical protein